MSSVESLAALGLTGNPFAADALPDFYFVGGQRRFLLQQAMHGLYIASSVVLVCGERGAGKTHLVKGLRAELNGLMDCCEIAASVLMDGGTIRRQLAELLGLPVESAVDNEALIEALARQVPVEVEPLPVALLIDDAHELAVSTLAELQQLVGIAHGRLRLLLAGEGTLLSAWQQLPVAAAELLELQPLDLQESADYLQTRLQAAGWRGPLPLTPERIQRLYRASGGCIGRLDELAPAALASTDAGDGSVSQAVAGRRMPWLWATSAAGLVLLAVVGISLINGGSEPELVRPAGQQAEEARTTIALPLSLESEVAPATDFAAATPLRESGQRVAVPAPLPNVPVSGTGGEEAALPVRAPAQKVAGAGVESKATPPVAERPQSPPAATEPAAIPKPPAAQPAQAPYLFDERKLLALAPDAVLLQLMASSSHEAVRAFVRANAATTSALLVETRRSGKPWFVLIAGPFADRATALAAISTLPEPLRKLKPWPRSAASVQSDVRAVRGGS